MVEATLETLSGGVATDRWRQPKRSGSDALKTSEETNLINFSPVTRIYRFILA
jgi:hypothetical protein